MLELPHGASSDDTYLQVFTQLKLTAFKQAFHAVIPTLMTDLRVMSFPLRVNVCVEHSELPSQCVVMPTSVGLKSTGVYPVQRNYHWKSYMLKTIGMGR